MSNDAFCLTATAAALCVIWAGTALAQAGEDTTSELARARMLKDNGSVRCERGEYAEAEKTLREALAIRERLLPPTDTQIAASLNDLGAAVHYQGRFQEAEPLYLRAIAIFREDP